VADLLLEKGFRKVAPFPLFSEVLELIANNPV
jgi:hypothetical protein